MRAQQAVNINNAIRYTILLLWLITASYSHADEINNQEDAELIRLRIKELELKKEILELEAKKENRQSNSLSTQPPSLNPHNTNSNNLDSSRYIRGPRGGCYTYTKSGNKRYVDRSLCN